MLFNIFINYHKPHPPKIDIWSVIYYVLFNIWGMVSSLDGWIGDIPILDIFFPWAFSLACNPDYLVLLDNRDASSGSWGVNFRRNIEPSLVADLFDLLSLLSSYTLSSGLDQLLRRWLPSGSFFFLSDPSTNS